MSDVRKAGHGFGLTCSHGNLQRVCLMCELVAERDALKADLESVKKAASCYREGAVEGMESFKMASEDRDAWKQKAEKLAEALMAIKNWTDWYTVKEIAKAALDEYGEGCNSYVPEFGVSRFCVNCGRPENRHE